MTSCTDCCGTPIIVQIGPLFLSGLTAIDHRKKYILPCLQKLHLPTALAHMYMYSSRNSCSTKMRLRMNESYSPSLGPRWIFPRKQRSSTSLRLRMDVSLNPATAAPGLTIPPNRESKDVAARVSHEAHDNEQAASLAQRDAGTTAWKTLCGAIFVQALLFSRAQPTGHCGTCWKFS